MSKENCYLFQSGMINIQDLKDDKIEYWNDFLVHPNIPNYFKEIIRIVIIPYEISLIKFSFNHDYWDEPQYGDESIVAPSFPSIVLSNLPLPVEYRKEFYFAFPDVAQWVIWGGGKNLVFDKYNSEKQLESITIENKYSPNMLAEIVRSYIKNVRKPLECKKYIY